MLIATRVTPRIITLVQQMADQEGLHVSEWVRKLIISELSSGGCWIRGCSHLESMVASIIILDKNIITRTQEFEYES